MTNDSMSTDLLRAWKRSPQHRECPSCEERNREDFTASLQQGFVDSLVIATLERSGLMAAAGLKKQRRDRQREQLVAELFTALTIPTD